MGSGFSIHPDQLLEVLKSNDPEFLHKAATEVLQKLAEACGEETQEVDVNMWAALMSMVNFYQTRAVYLKLTQKKK